MSKATGSSTLSELQWERLGVRMIHKICPVKDMHADLGAGNHCPECGLDGTDYTRLIAGEEGKR